MPKVTICPSAAAAAACTHAWRNSSGLRTTWSAASTSTRASRSRSDASTAPTATAGPEVAAQRLEHDVGLDTALAQLLGHHETEIGMGDNDRARKQVGGGYARKHLLKRGALSDQGNELLRHALARDRPQPRSRAAAHDYRNDLSRHQRPKSPPHFKP